MDEKRLAHMKRLYPAVQTTKTYADLIQDPELDAIAIATPVRFHFDLAQQSLAAGKHTFIEKPMASSYAECKELNDLAAKQKLTLMVGHTFIYTSEVRRIKDILKQGDLGDILYISSRRLNLGLFQKDINVAWDLAPHDISIILYLLDSLPVTVNCQGKAHIAEGIEDITNISLNFANGGFATIMSSWLDPNKIREMTLVGSKRMLVYNDILPQEKIKIYDKRVEVPPHYDTFAEFQYSYHYGDIYAPHLSQAEPLKVETQHFLDCIKTGQAPESCGEKGMQVVQILEACSASLRAGGAAIAIA
jgi:predicted dehydrogenase